MILLNENAQPYTALDPQSSSRQGKMRLYKTQAVVRSRDAAASKNSLMCKFSYGIIKNTEETDFWRKLYGILVDLACDYYAVVF